MRKVACPLWRDSRIDPRSFSEHLCGEVAVQLGHLDARHLQANVEECFPAAATSDSLAFFDAPTRRSSSAT
ncbi:hypothetical protein ACSETR_04525 [Pseudomonas aeruginosa]|uniref:Uncharacterized protein n=1 Tax=Pseudomonas aeruginosa TaxID=287 RepID=A0A6A9JUU6_PSEAI|nr:hypothetical protein [Pseudomonas aeruginosa]MBG7461264.1 hypothetical protein [Pseudomonas aeruginosa]MDG3816260.1 hypothetical protein [Pseudomonas aeruginosa]MUI56817.1 hypothetical protein [Pseudomonas aeruginosa]RCM88005.1 hypothetical protein PA57_04094 [Pseudomonas aeruginosa]HBO3620491.1 hypothetical protein [Pseudomonas aeruginosa]